MSHSRRFQSTDLQILRLWSIPDDMILVPAALKSALQTIEMSVSKSEFSVT